MELMKRLINDEEGQGLVEYVLIIAVVGILIIGSLTTFRGTIEGVFTDLSTKLDSPK